MGAGQGTTLGRRRGLRLETVGDASTAPHRARKDRLRAKNLLGPNARSLCRFDRRRRCHCRSQTLRRRFRACRLLLSPLLLVLPLLVLPLLLLRKMLLH
jgi:hypothetical protein